MSRDTEYQFVDTDVSSLVSNMVGVYERLTGVTVQPASPEKLFIQWAANLLLQAYAKLNYAANQNLPSRAEGANLDAVAELYFQQSRSPAKSAVCTVRFHISEPQPFGIFIPAGTRVTDSGKTLYWETTQNASIIANASHIDLTVRCQTAGSVGNGWGVGQISSIVDVYDYYSACENITESGGGADEMTDEELYEACLRSMDALSVAGPSGAYVYHAKSVSTEIADVAVTSPEPGHVCIYALMADGTIANEAVKALIYNACNADNVRPLTDYVTVADPATVSYDIILTCWLDADNPSGDDTILAAVREAVNGFTAWQSAKLGRDINPSRLTSLVMAVSGVRRVEVTSPAYVNLHSGNAASVPRVALVNATEIRNGGRERD